MIILETERLKMRAFLPQDAHFLFELNSDKAVLKYTGDEPFSNVEDALHFVKTYNHYLHHGYGRWLVLDKEDKPLGWCGLRKGVNEEVDIGFRFLKQFWGRGYASESARACIEYGFDVYDIHEIIGRSSLHNLASIRVLEKIGMTFKERVNTEDLNETLIYRICKNTP